MGKRRPTPRTFESAVGELNATYFFRDFTFSSNTFKPTPNKELELADKIVWLDDLLILSQIKERNAPSNTNAVSEQKWFADEVEKRATRQIRDTLTYLKTYPQIKVSNNRGHTFDIASAQVAQSHKIVIYHPHPLLPVECVRKKFHYSETAGVLIHLIDSAAYLGILGTLITPVEIADYLAFREMLVKTWEQETSAVSEKAILGQYLRNLPGEEPAVAFEQYVDELQKQDSAWDISKIIHLFPERQNTPTSKQETGYKVLQELAKLYRTDMAEFKKRFDFSMKKALADENSIPNRFTTSKDCGFVFIPLQRNQLPHRQTLLLNFTALNKYDQKLNKCIGLTFIAEGDNDWCDVQWCPMNFAWQEDTTLQEALDTHKPFRPVKEHKIERYGLSKLP